MMTKVSKALKQSGKFSLPVTLVFVAGMLISTYLLVTLPHQLTINGGLPSLVLAWPVLIKVFVSVGLTFLAGIVSLNATIQSRKEIVVYVEKKQDEIAAAAKAEEAAEAQQDLAGFRSKLEAAEDDILQEGLNAICQQWQAGQGAIYSAKTEGEKKTLEMTHGFAVTAGEGAATKFEEGEGLIGQVAMSGRTLYLDEIPEGYIRIISGLGVSSPRYLMIAPIRKGGHTAGVIEMATFSPINEAQRKQIEARIQILADFIQ